MNSQKDALFVLVKSLTKSEKRQFKLYANRLDGNTNSKYLSLFTLLDKMPIYKEKDILNKSIVKKQQLSNLKSHLYKQILISLRLNPVNKTILLQIREQLDFATILYHKGLYKQCFKILDKAKNIAIEHEYLSIALEIVEFEKNIESQYVTRSTLNRGELLAEQSKLLIEQNTIVSKLSNLSIQLYSMMLKTGYARSDLEAKHITLFFELMMPDINLNKMTFIEKLWYYKSHLWHSFLIQDFPKAYRYATKWVDLFYENKFMIATRPVFFMKGTNYLLEVLYILRYQTLLSKEISRFENLIKENIFTKNDNLESLIFMYSYSNYFNINFLEGNFKEVFQQVPYILEQLKKHENRIDVYHIMQFYYKIACMYFGMGDNLNCIKYLNYIIDNKSLVLREDLMCFSRILNSIAHYEEGLDYHLERELRSTYKFLLKMNDLHNVQREIIKFFKNLDYIYPQELKLHLKKLLKNLKAYENDPYERRSFLYLDIISWLESKIEDIPISEIIQRKSKSQVR